MLKMWGAWSLGFPLATPMLEPISRPLKSKLRRSQGATVCMSVCKGGFKKEGSPLHMFCRCDKLSSSLHKNGVNYAASQSVKVAHNQGGPETDGGFAKK